jgi:hypothetical protein
MANTLLTIDDITRESLRILHQKLQFVGNITRGYDDSFSKDGAKIGNTIRIRHPIQYSSSTGATIATGTGADSIESQTTLTVNTQRHVPMRFTTNEMTMKLDEFSSRHIEPAMAILAAGIESDALNMVDEVAQQVEAGTKVEFADIMAGRKKITDSLAPMSDRCALLDTQANVDLVDSLKGLFQDSSAIKKQYKEGMMGRTAGFDFYEHTLMPAHTSGAEGGGSAYLCNSATAQVGSTTNLNSMSLIVDTGTKTVKEGDVFTIAGVYDVHPESKVSTGELKQFTVLADFTGAGTITVSPALIATGPYQNASTGAANDATLDFVGAASTAYKQSLLFQKGFAVFGTADLVLPKGTHMASRQVYDGISMRVVQDYDVVKDRVYTRLDVLYGYKVLRPQLAAKVLHT